jgi:carboxymethylenebutenolidase
MDQRIIKLYDGFTHGDINRREFLDRLAELVGSTGAAMALLPLLQNDYAKAETVAANDGRLISETTSYDAAGTRMSGYLVWLKAKAKCPAVLLIHENRGLNVHIRDVARRLALEGFLTFAVDGLSPYGGTPDDDDRARDMFAANIKPEETASRMAAAVPFLADHRESTGSVGLVGFCWGGGIANRVTVLSPSLRAAVIYYGLQVPAAQVPAIRAPLLLHYAGLDERIDAGIPDFEAALKANDKRYTIYVYPGVNHAFNNDTSSRYDKTAAELAWGRTISFLKEHLGMPA